MRKIFGGAMMFSALGAVVLGGALAWNSTESITGTNTVGIIDFDIVNEDYTNNLLGPNGSPEVLVVTVELENDGTYSLFFIGGDVAITDVDSLDGTCLEGHFDGQVKLQPGSSLTVDPEIPPADFNPISNDHIAGEIEGYVSTLANAPEACQGSNVSWEMNVTAGTAPS